MIQGEERVALGGGGGGGGVEVLMEQNAARRTRTAAPNYIITTKVMRGAEQIRRTASRSEDTSTTEELSSESSKNLQQKDMVNRRDAYGGRSQPGSSRSLEQKSNNADWNKIRKVHSMGDLRGGALLSAAKAGRSNGCAERNMSSPSIAPRREKRIQSPNGILIVSLETGSTQYPSMELKWQEARRKRRQSKTKNGVCFGHIEIREHPIIPGDNPGGFYGPPLSIDWIYQSREVMKLEDYENERPPRRMGSQMNIPSTVRHEMLLNNGYTSNEIQRALRDVNIARGRRKRTIETLQLKPLQEALEKVSRGTTNFLFGRGRKQKERKYIRNAMKMRGACQGEEGHRYQEEQLPNDETYGEAPQLDMQIATKETQDENETGNFEKQRKRTSGNDDESSSSGEEEA